MDRITPRRTRWMLLFAVYALVECVPAFGTVAACVDVFKSRWAPLSELKPWAPAAKFEVHAPRAQDYSARIHAGSLFEIASVGTLGRSVGEAEALALIDELNSFGNQVSETLSVYRKPDGRWVAVTQVDNQRKPNGPWVRRLREMAKSELPAVISARLEAGYQFARQRLKHQDAILDLAELRYSHDYRMRHRHVDLLGSSFHLDGPAEVLIDAIYGEATIGVAPDQHIFQGPPGSALMTAPGFLHASPPHAGLRIVSKLAFIADGSVTVLIP